MSSFTLFPPEVPYFVMILGLYVIFNLLCLFQAQCFVSTTCLSAVTVPTEVPYCGYGMSSVALQLSFFTRTLFTHVIVTNMDECF